MPTFLWPLKKTLTRVVQGFGDPWSANTKKLHTGLDIPAAAGEKVAAAASGTVSKTGDLGKDWAHYVVLEHASKDYCTSYLHIDPIVRVGQKLQVGDLVGCVAKIPGSHLHFNVWKGQANQLLTQRGALPTTDNAGKVEPTTDPPFPSNFLDPSSFSYRYSNSTQETAESQGRVFTITRDLAKGSSGPDVKLLQQILNSDASTIVAISGLGSPGNESELFGDLTENAVQRFQIKYSIASAGTPGFGIVGPKTREQLRQIYQRN